MNHEIRVMSIPLEEGKDIWDQAAELLGLSGEEKEIWIKAVKSGKPVQIAQEGIGSDARVKNSKVVQIYDSLGYFLK